MKAEKLWRNFQWILRLYDRAS